MSEENVQHVAVPVDPRDPAVPTVPASEVKPAPVQDAVPEDRRADPAQIFVPSDGTTSRAPGPSTPDPLNTDAGDQFGEQPSPIPAEFAAKSDNADSGVRALPHSMAGVVRETPVVTGVRQVVVETSLPPDKPAAITASAPRVATVGTFGLVGVAQMVYGDPARARDIFDANRDTISDPDTVQVGHVVRLPD